MSSDTPPPDSQLLLARALTKIADQFERYLDLEEHKYFAERGLKGFLGDTTRAEPAIAAYESTRAGRAKRKADDDE